MGALHPQCLIGMALRDTTCLQPHAAGIALEGEPWAGMDRWMGSCVGWMSARMAMRIDAIGIQMWDEECMACARHMMMQLPATDCSSVETWGAVPRVLPAAVGGAWHKSSKAVQSSTDACFRDSSALSASAYTQIHPAFLENPRAIAAAMHERTHCVTVQCAM